MSGWVFGGEWEVEGGWCIQGHFCFKLTLFILVVVELIAELEFS